MCKGLKITQALDYVHAESKSFCIIRVISLKSFTYRNAVYIEQNIKLHDFNLKKPL